MVRVPPAAVSWSVLGDIVKVQVAAAALCVTVKFWPAMTIMPGRARVAVFGPATKITEPFPVPVAPLWMVIQDSLVLVVHAHPTPAATLTVKLPPAAGTVVDVELSE